MNVTIVSTGAEYIVMDNINFKSWLVHWRTLPNKLLITKKDMADEIELYLENINKIINETPSLLENWLLPNNKLLSNKWDDDELMSVFLEEAFDTIHNIQSLSKSWQALPKNQLLMNELAGQSLVLKGGGLMVGVEPVGQLSRELIKIIKWIVQPNTKLQEMLSDNIDELIAMLDAVHSTHLDLPTNWIKQIKNSIREEQMIFNTLMQKSDSLWIQQYLLYVTSLQVMLEAVRSNRSLDIPTNLVVQIRTIWQKQQNVLKTLIPKYKSLLNQHNRLYVEYPKEIMCNHNINLSRISTRLQKVAQQLNKERDKKIGLDRTRDQLKPLLDNNVWGEQEEEAWEEQQYAFKTMMSKYRLLFTQYNRLCTKCPKKVICKHKVPFSSISSRLQDATQQLAKEKHKRVNLTINGENIEFKRSFLNRIVDLLELMLINTIERGIEDDRQLVGKTSEGQIVIDVSEFEIKFSDDGTDLNLPNIHTKNVGCKTKPLLSFEVGIDFIDFVEFIVNQSCANLQNKSKTGEGTTFEISFPSNRLKNRLKNSLIRSMKFFQEQVQHQRYIQEFITAKIVIEQIENSVSIDEIINTVNNINYPSSGWFDFQKKIQLYFKVLGVQVEIIYKIEPEEKITYLKKT